MSEAIIRVLEEQSTRHLDSERDRLGIAIALLEAIRQPIADIISETFEQ